MIAPDMATMLGLRRSPTRRCRRRAAGAAAPRRPTRSFNAITVDSDTSTSDTLLLLATGAAGNAPVDGRRRPARSPASRAALDGVLLDLALQVVRDGEGAQKFIDDHASTAPRPTPAARRDRARDRQLAAGQDRDRRRGRQLGPRRHGGRQVGRAGRPATGWRRLRRPSRWPRRRCACPTSTRRRSPRTCAAARSTIEVDRRRRRRARPRCGPAT